MRKNQKIILMLLMVAAMICFAIFFYFRLPEQVPSHWDIHGDVDGYSGRFAGAFGLPIITAVLISILLALPHVDPLKKKFTESIDYYHTFILVFLMFFGYLYILTIFAAFKKDFDLVRFMIPGIGGLFFYIGSILPKIRQNWFMGIRTPWTLSDEAVWIKTHQLGGELFKISGALTLIGIFLPQVGFLILIISILLSALITTIYSYAVFKR